jgi:NitT/TauT family transport system substrate-binding protein
MSGYRYLVGAIGVAISFAWSSSTEAQDLQTVNFLSVNESSCSPFPQFAAQEFGFLEEEGLQVNLLASATTIPYVAFLANGDADITLLDSAQVFQAVDSDQPIKVVYEAYQFAPEGIVVPADSPIQGLADLKGTTIGLASDRDLTTTIIALESVGIDISEVKTVVVGDAGPTLVNSLRTGAIQAFTGSVGERVAIEAAGMAIRNITPPEVSRNPGNSFAVWGPTLEEKRPLIQGFLRAWAKAQHSGTLDTKAVESVCRKRVPEQWEQAERGKFIVNYAAYNTQMRRTKNFGELQPDVWAAVQSPYIKLGEIKGELDPATFLDGSFVDGANDFTTDDVKRGINAWKEANKDILVP